MQLLKMRYKDFVFASNPSKIEVLSSKSVSERALVNGGFSTAENSKNACVIKAEGTLYGEEAQSQLQGLTRLFNESGAGWLFLPNGRCFNAYFKTLITTQSADKGSVSYGITFVEKPAHRSEYYPFGYTYAQEGENAFDIAERCNISIEDLMDCNSIKTPFDIKGGDRIWLN